MAYPQIASPPTVPPEIRDIVSGRIDLFLADVHAMLRLPRPDIGIQVGCNFAALEMLCALISGLARVFAADTGSAAGFGRIMKHYPPDVHPLALATPQMIDALYETFRCNFSHSLGINVPNPQRGAPRSIVPLAQPTKVLRCVSAAREEQRLIELDDLHDRPRWLPPTLYVESGTTKLCVEALYWGCRKLVVNVVTDSTCVATAQNFLRAVQPAPTDSAPIVRAQSFEVSSSYAVVTSTLGALQAPLTLLAPPEDGTPG